MLTLENNKTKKAIFREMEELELLLKMFEEVGGHVQVQDEVVHQNERYPIWTLSIGSQNPEHPVIGFFGGVHGIEKIGSEVLFSYFKTILSLLKWDQAFQERLKKSRLVFMPIVNPVGVAKRRRSNGRGIDLMRNSPLDGEVPGGPFYYGHRYGSWLPYFRGKEGEVMERESQALCDFVEKELFRHKHSMAVDLHSGFGARDRLWFPYAYSRKPFPDLSQAHALKTLLDETYPNHFYVFEPVSQNYTIHGDLWDYLYEKNRQRPNHNFFFPLTLEMGSWIWLKKNPIQIFWPEGIWHPVKPHRFQRTLRRHLNLFDFLHRVMFAENHWMNLGQEQAEFHQKKGAKIWYES